MEEVEGRGEQLDPEQRGDVGESGGEGEEGVE